MWDKWQTWLMIAGFLGTAGAGIWQVSAMHNTAMAEISSLKKFTSIDLERHKEHAHKGAVTREEFKMLLEQIKSLRTEVQENRRLIINAINKKRNSDD